MNWNEHQNAIFSELMNPDGDHVVVQAKAGSGKTSTMVESIRRLADDGEIGIVAFAFNKSIAKTLTTKFNDLGIDWKTANAKTLHGAGYSLIKKAFPDAEMNQYKGSNICQRLILAREGMHLQEFKQIRKTPRGQRINDVVRSLNSALEICKGLLLEFHTEIENAIWDYGHATEHLTTTEQASIVIEALELCKSETDSFDFADMVWLPNVLGLKPSYKSNYVFVDEAQDMNPAQLKLAQSHVGGRLIAIGDSYQSIYGWNGADSKFLDRMSKRAVTLTLPTTYRCGQKIVDACLDFVTDFRCGSDRVGKVSFDQDPDWSLVAGPGDFILSRTNAPLAALAMRFLSAGIPCQIQGRNLGKSLEALVKRAKTESIEDLFVFLQRWSISELAIYKNAPNYQTHHDRIHDTVKSLHAICEGCADCTAVIKKIGVIFSDTDSNNVITLSTVHRAKGMERDRVFILGDTFTRSGPEENNIKYVAISRALHEVIYCYSPLTRVDAPMDALTA